MKGAKQLDLFEQMYQAMKATTKAPPRYEKSVVALMHEGVMEQSLNALSDSRYNEDHKEEIIQWVNSSFTLEPRPFSFQACCVFMGVDPDEMQTSVNRFIDGKMYGQRTIH